MHRTVIHYRAGLACLALAAMAACSSDGPTASTSEITSPQQFPDGIPLSGQLARGKLTMTSVISAELDRNVARVPLFAGTVNGERVWYVRMDVSDSVLAAQLGLNFAPRLANAQTGCPACVQVVQSTDPVPGRAPVQFVGGVDFSPARILIPGPSGFPPLMAQPGSIARAGYSDLIRVGASLVVWNAPIVATGNGPFDVSETHTNTLDRVMAIDTVAMTVDLQFIRAFAHGKDIFYFTFSSSAAISATLERATFVPVLATLAFPNDDRNPAGARAGIITIVNGKRGPLSPPAQGLMHVILDNPPGNLSLANDALLRALARGGDAHNVLAFFPTLVDPVKRRLYSPMWDLAIAVWSDAAVASGENHAQPDFNTIHQLANLGFLTNPGGAPLSSANFVVNCPVLGFAFDPPADDLVPRPEPRR